VILDVIIAKKIMLKAQVMASSFSNKVFFFNLFFYLWLHWVFVAVPGLALVVANGGYS